MSRRGESRLCKNCDHHLPRALYRCPWCLTPIAAATRDEALRQAKALSSGSRSISATASELKRTPEASE